MRAFGIIAVALLAAILLAVTNPSTEEFHQCIRSKAEAPATEKGVLATLGSSLEAWLVTAYSKQTARRQDYTLFSIYTLELDGQKQRWIGILGRFLPLLALPEGRPPGTLHEQP